MPRDPVMTSLPISSASAIQSDGRVAVVREGHVLLVRLDRPEKLNAITPGMLGELAAAYRLLDDDPDLRCALLHAEGDHFSSGIDTHSVSSGSGPDLSTDGLDPFAIRAPARKKPVVVALKGYCYTASVSLLLAADISVAAENSRFAMLEVKRGLMPAQGGVPRMIARAGWGSAMRYLLTGDEFDAATALRLNIVQEVVPLGQEFDRAIIIARCIASLPPLAVQFIRESGKTYLSEGWEASIQQVGDMRPRLFKSRDAREAVLASREKRAPSFVGQ